jgi:hypothetical protein
VLLFGGETRRFQLRGQSVACSLAASRWAAESDHVTYENALSTLAEIAIAIAGFSGIVSVFGRRSVGPWSVADRNRLLALVIVSLTALLFSVLPFVLLSIPVSESTCWQSLSFLLVIPTVMFAVPMIPIANEARRVQRNEREVSLAISVIFICGDLLAIVVLLINGLLLGVVWPYLAALIWCLARAAISFVRLIIVSIGGGTAA